MVASSIFAPPRPAMPFPRMRSGPPSTFLRSVMSAAASKPQLPRVVGMGSKLIGCGSAIPTLSVSNDDLLKIVETSDDGITAQNGMKNRRVLSGQETLLGLALQAAQRALEMAQVRADDVDLFVHCSSTPDGLSGGSVQVLTKSEYRNAFGCDIRALCCGFIEGLITASRYIKGGGFKNVLVVGADALSKVDLTDSDKCNLFGDAAGAVLVQACSADEDGMLGFSIQCDGNGQRHINAQTLNDESTNGVPEFPPRKATYSCFEMNVKEVFRFAVRYVPQAIEKALEEAGLPASITDWLLLHQANQQIIHAVASRLDIPSDKVISNLANYGNVGAASIPLALDEAVRSSKVKTGDIITASDFGAGLTCGSAIVRWG